MYNTDCLLQSPYQNYAESEEIYSPSGVDTSETRSRLALHGRAVCQSPQKIPGT